MAEKKGTTDDDPPGRLAELRDRVERATKLIAELREANYSLSSEIAELHRKLETLPSSPPAGIPSAPPPPPDREVHEELQQLRDERKIIRAKVQNLIERIERIEL